MDCFFQIEVTNLHLNTYAAVIANSWHSVEHTCLILPSCSIHKFQAMSSDQVTPAAVEPSLLQGSVWFDWQLVDFCHPTGNADKASQPEERTQGSTMQSISHPSPIKMYWFFLQMWKLLKKKTFNKLHLTKPNQKCPSFCLSFPCKGYFPHVARAHGAEITMLSKIITRGLLTLSICTCWTLGKNDSLISGESQNSVPEMKSDLEGCRANWLSTLWIRASFGRGVFVVMISSLNCAAFLSPIVDSYCFAASQGEQIPIFVAVFGGGQY